jgi:L,D-transpeptidase YcbB
MRISKTATVWALLMASASLLGAQNAHAITLMEMIRGKPDSSVVEVVPAKPRNSQGNAPSADADMDPTPQVKSPTYYTYKADPLRVVKLDGFFTPAVASAATSSVVDISAPADIAAPATAPSLKVKALEDVASALEAYYNAQPKLLWVSDVGVNDKARAVMDVLAKAGTVGLDPADYAVAQPDLYAVTDPAARDTLLKEFEIRLSTSVLTYIQDDVRGRVNPNKISEYYDFKRKTVNLLAALKNIAASPDVAAYVNSRTPDSPEFQALVKELATLRNTQTASAPRIVIAPGTLLKPGIANPELKNILAAIKMKASDALKVQHALALANYTGSDEYTPELVSLVEDFQKENGLKPDGIIGKASIRFLQGGDTSESKIAKVLVALEQIRWLPNDLGPRRVFINEPAFRAYYVQDYKEQFSMGVVVGAKAHQTYFFQDEIETVEFNPYWGVPRSIIVNEMLPKLRADAGYLDNLGYEVSVGGKPVSSSNIDWFKTSSVDVRQPPGSGNALGQLKILFPNAHSIYMHDTPQKSFFARDMRALSHGCVRLSDPKKMAAAVLGMTEDNVAAQIAGGKNKSVSVPQKFPVYVSYFTAWPNKDGVVEYFEDVYDRDTYLNKALTITKATRGSNS